jgi:hypothetical protein
VAESTSYRKKDYFKSNYLSTATLYRNQRKTEEILYHNVIMSTVADNSLMFLQVERHGDWIASLAALSLLSPDFLLSPLISWLHGKFPKGS